MKNPLRSYLRPAPIFLLFLFSLSCSSGDSEIPRELVDPFWLEKQPLPYEVAEVWLDNYKEISLLDVAHYQESFDFFRHLLPLLYREGFLYLDLWFLPEEKRQTFQEIIDAKDFSRIRVIDQLKDISAYQLQERYILFLESLWQFQQTLDESEASFQLQEQENVKTFHFIRNQADQMGPIMLLYSRNCPWPYEIPYHPVNILEQKKRMICLENKEESNPPVALVFWKAPEDFIPSPPLTDEIKKTDIPAILKDFPSQNLKKPAFLALWEVRRRLNRDFKKETP